MKLQKNYFLLELHLLNLLDACLKLSLVNLVLYQIVRWECDLGNFMKYLQIFHDLNLQSYYVQALKTFHEKTNNFDLVRHKMD